MRHFHVATHNYMYQYLRGWLNLPQTSQCPTRKIVASRSRSSRASWVAAKRRSCVLCPRPHDPHVTPLLRHALTRVCRRLACAAEAGSWAWDGWRCRRVPSTRATAHPFTWRCCSTDTHTLLCVGRNHILSADHGKKIAVVENEFGEVGIDDQLLQDKFNVDEDIFEVNNGCICCTVRVDLITILDKLSKRHNDPNNKLHLDHIVIETTGLADPAPVAQTFFVDENVKTFARLDGIVTLVDAKHIEQHLDEVKPEGAENEAVEQVASLPLPASQQTLTAEAGSRGCSA